MRNPARKRPKPRTTLTAKERVFVREYVRDPNAAQAAARAGYSEHSAKQIGSKLLGKPLVALELRLRRRALERSAEVDAERIVRGYARIASARISDYMSFGPKGMVMRDWSDLDDDALDAVAEVRERVGKNGRRTFTFKLHSKLDALHALGKHFGLFVDKHEVDISARLSDALTEIMGRLGPAAREELVRAIGMEIGEPSDDVTAEDAG